MSSYLYFLSIHRYTSKKTNDTDFVFAIVLKYPATNDIDLYGIHAVIDKVANVRMLGYDQLITVIID